MEHDFDLDNGNKDTKFQCKNCSKTLYLDIEDMMNLPKEMKEGCPITPIDIWFIAEGLEFCQRRSDRLIFEKFKEVK